MHLNGIIFLSQTLKYYHRCLQIIVRTIIVTNQKREWGRRGGAGILTEADQRQRSVANGCPARASSARQGQLCAVRHSFETQPHEAPDMAEPNPMQITVANGAATASLFRVRSSRRLGVCGQLQSGNLPVLTFALETPFDDSRPIIPARATGCQVRTFSFYFFPFMFFLLFSFFLSFYVSFIFPSRSLLLVFFFFLFLFLFIYFLFFFLFFFLFSYFILFIFIFSFSFLPVVV